MHSLRRKNVSAIDHMLHSVVLSIGGCQFHAMAIKYGKLSTQRHYSCYPPHCWQFDYAHAKNILNGDTTV